MLVLVLVQSCTGHESDKCQLYSLVAEMWLVAEVHTYLMGEAVITIILPLPFFRPQEMYALQLPNGNKHLLELDAAPTGVSGSLPWSCSLGGCVIHMHPSILHTM